MSLEFASSANGTELKIALKHDLNVSHRSLEETREGPVMLVLHEWDEIDVGVVQQQLTAADCQKSAKMSHESNKSSFIFQESKA